MGKREARVEARPRSAKKKRGSHSTLFADLAAEPGNTTAVEGQVLAVFGGAVPEVPNVM